MNLQHSEITVTTLTNHFSKSSPSIRWAGSMAKSTIIKASYDGDMTVYFPEDETEAGDTLEEIYEAVEKALQDEYWLERKASAIRILNLDSQEDLHIDVVPGRYVDDTKSDVFLHRTTGDKARLKTNLQIHIDHIKDSGVIDAIKLGKLWKVKRHVTQAQTFVLELLIVKLLEEKIDCKLSDQLLHVLTEFAENSENLSVTDPANSNNDLKTLLAECLDELRDAAEDTLAIIKNEGWEAVFAKVRNNKKRSALRATVAAVATPNRPWCG